MKQSNKKTIKFKSILRLLLILVCGAVVGFNVYLANANSLVGNKLPMPFGYGAAVVLSDSMKPELSKGDLIIVSEKDSYAERDVVVFQENSMLVVHRIIKIDGETVTTKGDANNAEDAPVNLKEIKGEVIFHVPYVGDVVNVIKSPIGTICVIALAIILIEIPRRSEKKKDDEEKQKIIDEINRLKTEALAGNKVENKDSEEKTETEIEINEENNE